MNKEDGRLFIYLINSFECVWCVEDLCVVVYMYVCVHVCVQRYVCMEACYVNIYYRWQRLMLDIFPSHWSTLLFENRALTEPRALCFS